MLLLLMLLIVFGSSNGQIPSSLRFVQVWFRHGERMPTHYLTFPGQQPINFDFAELAYPGELTNRGMEQEFEKGKLVRDIYDKHFGKIYRPNEILFFTGKDNRTSVSGQAFMAGFYPPESVQRWNSLKWLPIAQHMDESIDWVSTGLIDNCPVMKDAFVQAPEYTIVSFDVEKRDPELIQLLRNKTGEPLNSAKTINHAIDSLRIRDILNDTRFPLPDWARGYEMRTDSAGYWLHDGVLNAQNQTVGAYHSEYVLSLFERYLNQEVLKGAFISGHDTNIMAIWKAFSLQPHPDKMPYFGAHISVELHEIEGQHVIKFWLSMGYDKRPTEVFSQFCGSPCTLEALQRLTESTRLKRKDFLRECKGLTDIVQNTSTITGSMILLVAIFMLSTLVFGCTTCFYRKQLKDLKDPERTRLLA